MKTKPVIESLRALVYRMVVAVLRFGVRPSKRESYKLTILKLDRLGDAVLSLGVVRRMVSHVGPGNVLLVVSDIAEPLYRMEFPNVDFLVLPAFCERWSGWVRALVGNASDLRGIATENLVCLRHQPSDYLHAIVQLLEPQQCYASAWEKKWERSSLSFPACLFAPYPETSPGTCLELEAHRRVAESFLNVELGVEDVLPPIRSVEAVSGNSLLVCPMAGTPLREYPAPLLAMTVRFVSSHRPNTPITFCLPPGVDRIPWADALTEQGVIEVEWKHPKDVQALIQVIAEAGVVLGPDSAPAHLATALDKRGVFLLGGGHFGMFAPWKRSDKQIWLSHALDCYQCRWRCVHSGALCVTQIAPLDVAQAILRLMPEEKQTTSDQLSVGLR